MADRDAPPVDEQAARRMTMDYAPPILSRPTAKKIIKGKGRPSARSSPAARGRAVLSPYPEVREKIVEYLNLPPLPRAPRHLRYSDDQPRDENGRIGEGGGG